MSFLLQPWQLLFLAMAGWVNRQQQDVIEYLITENQVLKEKLGKKRILLNDDQRRRLAVKGKILGRKLLLEIATPRTAESWGGEVPESTCPQRPVTGDVCGYPARIESPANGRHGRRVGRGDIGGGASPALGRWVALGCSRTVRGWRPVRSGVSV